MRHRRSPVYYFTPSRASPSFLPSFLAALPPPPPPPSPLSIPTQPTPSIMRLLPVASTATATAMLYSASLASAGLLDRFRAASPSSIEPAPAAPSPPSEPFIDAFGGSAAHGAMVQDPVPMPVAVPAGAGAGAGAPSVAAGQPAVKTAVPVNVLEPETPYEGLEWKSKYYRVCLPYSRQLELPQLMHLFALNRSGLQS